MLKEKYDYDTPFFREDLSTVEITELQELLQSGEVRAFDKNNKEIYYFWTTSIFGESKPNPYPVIHRRYITNGDNVYGYISGMTLLNTSGVSTQVPKRIHITTNYADEREYTTVKIGICSINIKKPVVRITKQNVSALQFLDLISSVNIDDLDDFHYESFIDFKNKLKLDQALIDSLIGFFPDSLVKLKTLGML